MSTTTWLSDIEKKAYPPLEGHVATDVVIVGAGLVGSISAYLLAKEGKKVIVIDKGDIEYATTAYTTGWITTNIDTDFTNQLKMYGTEKTKAIFDSGNAAIDAIERIVKEENIACDFVRSSVFMYASNYKETRFLEREHQAAQSAGIQLGLEKKTLKGFKNLYGHEFPQQAKFHPLKFVQGVQEAAMRYGAQFHHFTEAVDVKGVSPVVVVTKKGTISALHCILATYQPLGNPKELFAKKGMYKSYVVEAQIPKGLINEGMYLDCANPYHYFRVDPGAEHDRIIFGGEDHRKEVPVSAEKNFQALQEQLRFLIEGTEYDVVREWVGNVLESVDGLPYIGVYAPEYPNRLIATGFSGNGMHFSMIAAQVFRDIILGKENRDRELYDARRTIQPYHFFKKTINFVGEFVGGALKNLFK